MARIPLNPPGKVYTDRLYGHTKKEGSYWSVGVRVGDTATKKIDPSPQPRKPKFR